MEPIWIVRIRGKGVLAHVVGADGRPRCRALLTPAYWRQLAAGEEPPATGRCFRCLARSIR
jgi:hypothetical protein